MSSCFSAFSFRLLLSIVISFLLSFLFEPVAVGRASAAERVPMDFIVVMQAGCSERCPRWISAEGDIEPETPARLRKLLKSLGKQKLPIVLTSNGGDLEAAYALGRLIRKNKLDVAVGTTRLTGCIEPLVPRCKTSRVEDGVPVGRSFVDGGYCASACPMMLAGGVRKFAPLWDALGVHQVTTTTTQYEVQYDIQYKMVKGKKKVISRKEVGRKYLGTKTSTKLSKRNTANLAAYLKEMGVDRKLIDLVESASPDDIYLIHADEAIPLGLITAGLAKNEMPIDALCSGDLSKSGRCGVTPDEPLPFVPPIPVAKPVPAVGSPAELTAKLQGG